MTTLLQHVANLAAAHPGTYRSTDTDPRPWTEPLPWPADVAERRYARMTDAERADYRERLYEAFQADSRRALASAGPRPRPGIHPIPDDAARAMVDHAEKVFFREPFAIGSNAGGGGGVGLQFADPIDADWATLVLTEAGARCYVRGQATVIIDDAVRVIQLDKGGPFDGPTWPQCALLRRLVRERLAA